MRTIAFVTEKGGSGKSTLASSLAAAAREMDQKVAVVDMDPQGSLMNWHRARDSDDIAATASNGARLPSVLASLKAADFTLAILDTPGAEGPASAAAMATAELCVIPSRPSMFDLWASARTCVAVKAAGGDFVFLLNQCPPAHQTSRVRDCVETLEELGGLLSPLVLSRVDYQEAARLGLGVTELNPGGAAAEEMRALWISIRRRLARATPRAPARAA
jgi:chromosome partitioning protein